MQTASDEDLMLAYAKGRPEAFDELFARYGRKVYNLFLRALGNAETAGDLVQETFLRVISARERYQPTRTFASWLYTIAMNLLRDQLRQRKRRGAREDLSETILEMRVSESDIELSERLAAVQKAVQSLPEEQREVILLAKYQGLSYAEIAGILGISEAAAKQRAYRALKTLREKLIHLKR
ncbi:sigma-70 family RNA polymerase sigma factor [candidate division KSB1 bacterium]|nr:sigma-70 family RNA polymerase sigma factor [candidate division KSB1 bacterium]